jgi:dolichol kinase
MSPDRSLLTREALRKSIHMAGFIIPLAYYFFIPRILLLAIMGSAVAVAAILELFRARGIPIFPSVLLRRHEEKGVLAGYFYAVLSAFLAVLLFDKTIAVAAILYLDLGDGITGLAGVIMTHGGKNNADMRDYGRKPGSVIGDIIYAVKNHKSPILMAVMLIVCGLIGFALYPSLMPTAIAAGALGAMVADAFPWRFFGVMVDDNLSIPLLSGALMVLVGAH